jgi:hypothetical protein
VPVTVVRAGAAAPEALFAGVEMAGLSAMP